MNFMKYHKSRFSLYSYLLILFFICSCSSSSPSVSPPYKAWILSLDLEKSTLGSPYYSLSVKDLKGLDSLSALDGGFFTIKEKATIDLEDMTGSIAVGEKKGSGEDPYLRYKVKDSAIVPKDYNTLILLSVYHQFYYLFEHLKEYTGIEPTDLVKKAENNKMWIFYEPVLTDKTGDSSGKVTMKVNASYFSGQKQFILWPRSELERTPIAVGLSVLAHEFGHSLFEYVFYGDRNDESSSKYDESYAISGLNEGFADYTSYIYTGVSNILGAHFLFEDVYMERDFVASTFTYDNMSLEKKTNPNSKNYKSYCTGGFYCHGTLLARSFYQASITSGYSGDKKYEYYKKIVDALYKTREVLDAKIAAGELNIKDPKRKMLSAFLYAFLKNFDSSLRATLCESLIKNFDSIMNKGDHAEVCPESSFKLSDWYRDIDIGNIENIEVRKNSLIR